MTLSEIIERMVLGAQRTSTLPADRLRVIAEAAFPQISNEVAEAFAQTEARRSTLRNIVPLVFAAGTSAVPDAVLKKYLDDATLVVNGVILDYREPYADFARYFETRLGGVWAVNDSIIYANTPVGKVLTPYVGPASLTCISAPAIPASATAPYVAPGDLLPQLIDAGISFLLGATVHVAAQVA